MKAEAAVWNWAWLILAVGGLILVLSIKRKVRVACYVVGPLEYTVVEQDRKRF